MINLSRKALLKEMTFYLGIIFFLEILQIYFFQNDFSNGLVVIYNKDRN